MLHRQLKWLASDISGYESDCEIIISDNCSPDNTKEVVEVWKSALSPEISVTYHRNDKNIGAMANIVLVLNKAGGKFVWSLGDDDPIQNGTIGYLISKIKEHSNLSMLLLNASGRDVRTDKILAERWFDSTTDRLRTNSVKDFEHFLSECLGGIMFITSAMYRTKLVHEALLSWPESTKNLAAQAYWVAYCAARGGFIVTQAIHAECAMGIGFTDKDPRWLFKMLFGWIPDVFLRLILMGYSRRVCFAMIARNFRNFGAWRMLLGAFRRWPNFTTRWFVHYVRVIVIAMFTILGRNVVRHLWKRSLPSIE